MGLIADRAYDTDEIIAFAEKHYKILVIPAKKSHKIQGDYDKELCKMRHLVENDLLKALVRQKPLVMPNCPKVSLLQFWFVASLFGLIISCRHPLETLTIKVHMIWTKTVCGRLTSRIRYSAKIVYNNFVWMQMYPNQFVRLLDSAKKILSVRKNYPDASLADLYDPVTMPKDLRDAHRAVDKVVMEIYGFSDEMTEEEIAIELLEYYYLASENLKAIQRKNFDDEEYFDDAE